MAFGMNTGFLSFKIKAIEKPKKEKKPSNASLITGTVIKDDQYDYLVQVRTINGSQVNEVSYRITEESYSCYNKTAVYSRKPNKKGVYTVILKNNNDCKLYFEGQHLRFVPFKPGIKVKGKIVNNKDVKLFDIIEVCNPDCYVSF